jgi:hypothetical protein
MLANSILIGGLLIFTGFVYFHMRLKKRIALLRDWIEIKRTHVARCLLDWTKIPSSGEYNIPSNHPFALDLDIVGEYSLSRLLDTTFSSYGREKLISTLLQTSPVMENVAHQQRLVRELIPRSLLRDKLFLKGSSHNSEQLPTEAMAAALRGSPVSTTLRRDLYIEAGLAFLTLGLILFEYVFDGGHYWPYTLLIYVIGQLVYVVQLHKVFERVIQLQHSFKSLEDVLQLLEQRSDSNAPALTELCIPLSHAEQCPSRFIHKLSGVCNALSIRANPLVRIIVNLVCPWDMYFSYRFECLRAKLETVFPIWMDVIARIEVASALAQFADYNSEYIFPIQQHLFHFEVEALGHPLIPKSKRILNDFSLTKRGTVALVTGSNMSGKSTFLRTVGINVCLAQAGGPVCAKNFSASLMRVYCSIRITDNLNAGLSHFYAEVKRLAQIIDAIKNETSPAVLFLIDEIFKGTNNKERYIGGIHFIKALTHGNAFGIVTTHDLDLTRLEAHNTVINYHFCEEVSENQLTFDYKLRSGPCPTTNALYIMAMEGLPVPKEPTTK